LSSAYFISGLAAKGEDDAIEAAFLPPAAGKIPSDPCRFWKRRLVVKAEGRASGAGPPSTEETAMTSNLPSRIAIIVARLIFAGVFAMAMSFKFMSPGGTAEYIASIGFPAPLLFAWLAAFFELGLVISFLSGAFFREAAVAAAIYVVFLAFAFHGPAHWTMSQAEFGFFVDHFTFLAGLLFAAVHGPGDVLALRLDLSDLRHWRTAAHVSRDGGLAR
jgi:putative oxidoreductase